MNDHLLRKYAKLGVVMGVNLQKGQTLVVNTSVEGKELARMVVEEAYKLGAKEVIVNWNDDFINRMHCEYQSIDTLTTIPDWMVEQKVNPLKEGAAILHLISDVPGILAGIEADKIAQVSIARQRKYKEANEMTMANKTRWSILGVPNASWAKKVFPDLEKEAAIEKLWEMILLTTHVKEDNDPIEEWKAHNLALRKRMDILNSFNFKSLHFANEEGTDLTIELVKHHIWCGGSECAQDGVEFNANMPTEEIFTMPYKYGVNGKVVSTKPLNYNGTLVSRFELVFEEGEVIAYKADDNIDALTSLINFDEGSRYIGEVALVPFHSPISQSNVLFYNTLYDENASCHLALGRAYPINVKGGCEMSQEQLDEVGSNNSMTHVDFMFGSSSMKITGETLNGDIVPVFENGDFVF
ncbi:MAG: aminopeptidase [Erysipelotrichia bacterium]|nr:aminopeptidase [Erysipelotrichia bacterium]NCC55038.1 aminopeptidase [Erysipelotrichia bacterium]